MTTFLKTTATAVIAVVVIVLASLGFDSQNTPTIYSDFASIQQAEENYFKTHQAYFQVLPNNVVPSYETGDVATNLGKSLPPQARIDIYQTPDGSWGYQIIFDSNGVIYSVATGTESTDRTFVASTTPDTTTATSAPTDI